MAGLPDAQLPCLGALRALPAWWGIRIPRPASGRSRAARREARPVPRAAAPGRVAAVRRGRRAALVASAERTRDADPVLGRPVVAAVRDRKVSVGDGRRGGSGGGG